MGLTVGEQQYRTQMLRQGDRLATVLHDVVTQLEKVVMQLDDLVRVLERRDDGSAGP